MFIQDIIHIQIDNFHTNQEANRSELVIGGCKTSRNMLDAQQALSLPNIHLKMILGHFQWLFQYLPLFPIEEN
jgi:hypothetical protein